MQKGEREEQNHSGELEITRIGDLVEGSTGYFGKHQQQQQTVTRSATANILDKIMEVNITRNHPMYWTATCAPS